MKEITNDYRSLINSSTRSQSRAASTSAQPSLQVELAYRHILGFTGERCTGRRQWRGADSARAQGALRTATRAADHQTPAAEAPVKGCPLSCETRAGSGRAPTTSRMGLFKGKKREKTEAEQVAEDYNIIVFFKYRYWHSR